jgi:hypothetical protein
MRLGSSCFFDLLYPELSGNEVIEVVPVLSNHTLSDVINPVRRSHYVHIFFLVV